MTQIIDIKPKIWRDMFTESALALEALNLYDSNLLYRSFSPERLEHVLKNGTDRDKTSNPWRSWGVDTQNLLFLDSEILLIEGYWICHNKDDIWTVAVYDPTTLNHITSDNYSLKEGAKPGEYDGKFCYKATLDEILQDAIKLRPFVRNNNLIGFKHRTSKNQPDDPFYRQPPVMIVYAKEREKDNVLKILQSIGVTNARWIADSSQVDPLEMGITQRHMQEQNITSPYSI